MLVFSSLTNTIGAQHCPFTVVSILPLPFHEKLSHFLVDVGVFLSHILTIAKHIICRPMYKQSCQNPQNDFYGPGSEYILGLRTRYCQGGTVIPN